MSAEQIIAVIGIPVVAGLATAVAILFKQVQASQKAFEAILKETVQCFATVAELQRQTNTLLADVKQTLLLCNARED